MSEPIYPKEEQTDQSEVTIIRTGLLFLEIQMLQQIVKILIWRSLHLIDGQRLR